MTAKINQADEIYTVLATLSSELSQLLAILKDEHQSILKKDTELLSQHADQKNQLVSKIDQSHGLLDHWLNNNANYLEYRNNINTWLKSQSEPLKSQFQKFLALAKSVEQANSINGQLLNRQVNTNRFLMSLLMGQTGETATYNNAGNQSNGRQNSTIGTV